MPKFKIEVPVTVFCTYEVEAADADAALDVPVTIESMFNTDSMGGISRKNRTASISGPRGENAEWDRAEVFPVDK